MVHTDDCWLPSSARIRAPIWAHLTKHCGQRRTFKSTHSITHHTTPSSARGLNLIAEPAHTGEPLCHRWPQAGSAADRRPERAKWGRQPRSRRQPGGGAVEFFAASGAAGDRRQKSSMGAKPRLPTRYGGGQGVFAAPQGAGRAQLGAEARRGECRKRLARPRSGPHRGGRRPREAPRGTHRVTLESDTQCGREGKPGKEFCLQNDLGCAGSPTSGGEP